MALPGLPYDFLVQTTTSETYNKARISFSLNVYGMAEFHELCPDCF